MLNHISTKISRNDLPNEQEIDERYIAPGDQVTTTEGAIDKYRLFK